MADNDSIKQNSEKTDPSKDQEPVKNPEPLFQMGHFKLLSDDELKALEPVEAVPVADEIPTTSQAAEHAENIAEVGSEPQTHPYDGPRYFSTAGTQLDPLPVREIRSVVEKAPVQDLPPHTLVKPGVAVPTPPVANIRKKAIPESVRTQYVYVPIQTGFWAIPLVRIIVFFLLLAVVSGILGIALYPFNGVLNHHLRLKNDLGFACQLAATLISAWIMIRYNENEDILKVVFERTDLGANFVKGGGIAALVLAIGFIFLAITYYYEPGDVNTGMSLLAPLLICAIISISDETMYRGFVLRVTEDRFGSLSGILSACICCMILTFIELSNTQLPGYEKIAAPVLIGFGEGIALGAAYVMTRSIWASIGLRFMTLFIVGPLLGFNASNSAADWSNSMMHGSLAGPYWLCGGSTGPESATPIAICFMITGLVMMQFAMRNGNWRYARQAS